MVSEGAYWYLKVLTGSEGDYWYVRVPTRVCE